jgi:hypothetical protein
MRVARLLAIFLLTIAAAAALTADPARSTEAALVHAPPAFLIGHSQSLNWAGYASYNGPSTPGPTIR